MGTIRAARERAVSILSSCAHLAVILIRAAAALYPVLLPSSFGLEHDITLYNSATRLCHAGRIYLVDARHA